MIVSAATENYGRPIDNYLSPDTAYPRSVIFSEMKFFNTRCGTPLSLILAIFASAGCGTLFADTLIGTTTYTYTGSAQSYTVPEGANYVIVKAWGGGGGGASAYDGWSTPFYTGGSGLFVSAIFDVVNGVEFQVSVAGGGTGHAGSCGVSANASDNSRILLGGWPGGGNGTALIGYTLGLGRSPTVANGGAGGGGFSRVETPYGTIWAGGGGGSGAGKASLYGVGPTGTVEQGGSGLLWAAGGGGGGYIGGNAGGNITGSYTWGGGWVESGHGAPGSSLVSGLGKSVSYTNPGGGHGLGGTLSSPNGGNGRVVIEAYSKPSAQSNLVMTFRGPYTGTYSVPDGIAAVTVKAWGAGGGGSSWGNAKGGAGGFVRLLQTVTAGDGLEISAGLGGVAANDSPRGGTATQVKLPNGARLIVGGGGGSGGGSEATPNGNGGAGGAPNGQAGGGGYGNSGGGGGAVVGSGSGTAGVAGAGGIGGGYNRQYDEEQNEIGGNNVGNGGAGTITTATVLGQGGVPGYSGNDDGSSAGWVTGGYGGAGLGGGGAGGSGRTADSDFGGGGGGGGGSSGVISASVGSNPTNVEFYGSSNGTLAPNTSDPHYPGDNVGAGGLQGEVGGPGAVVIILHPAEPVISSALAVTKLPGEPVNYAITVSGGNSVYNSFSVANLPPGLFFSPTTGVITGQIQGAGSYSTILTASNGEVSRTATLNWTVAPDTQVPTAAANLSVLALGATSATLGWTASSDNAAVVGYEIVCNQKLMGFYQSLTASFGSMTPETNYAFTIRAKDFSGNWSSPASLTLTTPADSTAPSVPTLFRATNVSATSLVLEWAPSTDDVGVTAYELSRGGTVIEAALAVPLANVTGLSANTDHTFTVRARDAKGNWSAASSGYTVKTPVASADTLLATTVFNPISQATQTYTVPAGADYVVVKVWGAGGGAAKNGSTVSGGYSAGFTGATLPAKPGQTYSVSVGRGGYAAASLFTTNNQNSQANAGTGGWPSGANNTSNGGGGGGYSSVATPTGIVWAQGGAGALGFGGSGGVYPGLGSTYVSALAYNIDHVNSSLAPAKVTDPNYPGGRVGCGGAVSPLGSSNEVNGGSGIVVIQAYKNPDTNPPTVATTYFPVSASTQIYSVPAGVSQVEIKAWGGGGGGGETSDGGAGGFVANSFTLGAGQTISVTVGAGGGWENAGGASVVALPGGVTLTASGGVGGSAPSGSTAPNANDTHYPGNNIGYGGRSNGYGTTTGTGGAGAVVVVAYFNPPVITSPPSYFTAPGAPVNYTITATNAPTSFSATGLPAGLTLNPTTGVISGSSAVSGTSIISATNAGGQGANVVLTWTFGTDSTSPDAPTGLQASGIYSNSLVLSWNAAYDNFGVTDYEVFVNDASRGSASTTCSTAVLGLAPNTLYKLQVRARDGAGNWSALSGPLNVTTTTQAPPSTTVATSTFVPTTTTQTYTVPTGASYVVVKAWGSGGSAGASTGGAGAFISAAFSLTGGQTIGVSPGYSMTLQGDYRGATMVTLPGGTALFAGAGGEGGEHPDGRGGSGGAPIGENGGGGAGNSGGGGGGIGYGGPGGIGNGTFDEDDGPQWVGGGTSGGLAGQYNGGSSGNTGNQGNGDPLYYGGGGGGGLTGGGGGGSGTDGGGGGGGGSSGVVLGSLSPLTSFMLAGNAATPPNATDANYPGNGVAHGGSNGGYGGNGYVAILAYGGPPLVTSVLARSVIQYQPVSYTIAITGQATSFAASGLPAGLVLNPSSGVISGSVAIPGTYSSIIGATSATGTAQATLVWTVTADNTAPSIPTGLVAGNLALTSFRLSWTASTDNVAVASYQIFKGGVSVGSTANTYFDVTGLTAGTTYSFTVVAKDGVPNSSAASSALSVTISTDTVSPTTVTNFALAGRTATTSTLTWAAAADNFGVVAYEIYDGSATTPTATTTELSYVFVGTGAHSFTVVAVDAAGKKSAVSAAVTVASTVPAGALADTDGDGIPDDIETTNLLGTSPSTTATPGTNSTLPLNLHRPTP